jgi:hypothetical protein
MKRRATSEKPEIRVTVTETTWQALAQIAAAPREFLIALSRMSSDHVRALIPPQFTATRNKSEQTTNKSEQN